MTDVSALNSATNSSYTAFMDEAAEYMDKAADCVTEPPRKCGTGEHKWEADMAGYQQNMMKAQIFQQAANSHMKSGNEMIGNILKAIDAATDKVSSAVERTVG